MRKSNIDNYQYLLKLYNLVSEYLSANKKHDENLSEIIISFCTVTEKVFKIILYKKNPVLVFDHTKLKVDDELVSIVNNKERNVETIRSADTVNRYRLIFKDKFSDEEVLALRDVYNIRNDLIHGYKPDNKILLDEENIIKKMGTIWEKISEEVISLFGADKIKASKPRRKYTEEELESILLEEVRKKITKSDSSYNVGGSFRDNPFNYTDTSMIYLNDEVEVGLSGTEYSNNRCPRCGAYGFSSGESMFSTAAVFSFGRKNPDLYKCKKCNLELTKKEYEMARKIQHL